MIIDDSKEDAEALVRALASDGVGAIVFSGEPAAVMPRPPKPLHGIRLALVDMNLVEGISEPRAIIGTLMSVLEEIIAPDNGPYLAIAWTKEPELVELFAAELRDKPFRPVAVLTVAKADVRGAAGEGYDSARILEKVKAEQASVYPLELVDLWEQVVHDAASDTTNMTLEEGSEWTTHTRLRLRRLAIEAMPASSDPVLSLRGLLEALNLLAFDAAESIVLRDFAGSAADPVRPLMEQPAESEPINFAGDLNRRLWIGASLALPVPEQAYLVPAPGSVFLAEPVRKCAGELAVLVPPAADLESEVANSGLGFDWNETVAVPLLVEITASCDFQNQKASLCKFLAGLAVPNTLGKKQRDALDKMVKERAPAIRAMPPVKLDFDGLNGEYYLLWHAKHTFALPASRLQGCSPIWRFREPVLQDLQTWAGNRGSRPAFLQVR